MPRVIIFMQENKTTDFYFPTLAAWGADVRNDGNLLTTPPDFDQPHDRNAWVHYQMGDYSAADFQIDNDTVIPYYSWLAKQFTFCDHHFGLGSNSTPGHMLAVGGQTPTLRNPSSKPQPPVWDLPTIFKHVERGGFTWGAFPSDGNYPLQYYAELADAASKAHIYPPAKFIEMAQAGTLPDFCFVWSPGGSDEHPPQKPDPTYIRRGQDLVWQRIDAVVQGGGWANTTFILTWDDWGGYTDHIATPDAETVPDALHPGGFQVIGGSRIPLLMFGGQVRRGIESSWHSHASLPKTVIDLFGLPPFGVPRVDGAPSLAGCVDPTLNNPTPPAYGSAIVQPPAPKHTPQPVVPPPFGGPNARPQPMPPLVANHGATIPAPTDGIVRPRPPVLPSEAGWGGGPGTEKVLHIHIASRAHSEAFHRAVARTRPQPISIGDLASGFPPTPQFDLVYQGGETLRDLVFTSIYLGGDAAWAPSDRANIDTALAAALADEHLNNVLMQYFGNQPITATFKPSLVLPGRAAHHYSQQTIEHLVATLAGNGALAGYDLTGTVFNFMLPKGVTLSAGPDSSENGLGGFHGEVQTPQGKVLYAVGVYSMHRPGKSDNGIVAFDESWKNVVATFYHELTEVRSDADVNGTPGWISPPIPEFGNASQEIGDIPMDEAGANLSLVMKEVPLTAPLADGTSTVPIQLMYSNFVHGPEGPIPAPHGAETVPTLAEVGATEVRPPAAE